MPWCGSGRGRFDPLKGTCLLHAEPVGERHRAVRESDFGEPVPVGTVLGTTALYVC